MCAGGTKMSVYSNKFLFLIAYGMILGFAIPRGFLLVINIEGAPANVELGHWEVSNSQFTLVVGWIIVWFVYCFSYVTLVWYQCADKVI